jgi:L-ascorbate metabolism protein UlaG (beta-lactamase superfamily)
MTGDAAQQPLIEPVARDQALIDAIARQPVGPDEVAVWWLGQSGYAVKTAAGMLYIDLYLSEHLTVKYANSDRPHIRMTRAPLQPGSVRDAALVLASHKHSDHLDPGGIGAVLAASADARLVLPAPLLDYAADTLGLARTRMTGLRGDEGPQVFAELPGITIEAVPSAHPTFEHTEAGHAYLGFLIRIGALTLYHSGDTVVYDGLAERLRAAAVDLAFLPINGHVAPGTAPNMSGPDAVALARSAGIRLTVPHHYDMFTFNTVPVSHFTEPADRAGIAYHVMQPGGVLAVAAAR